MERPTPAPPLLRVDRDAGGRQCFEIAPGCALGHLELDRDLGRRDLFATLEHQQSRHQPVGTHGFQ
jgi:hypothetical protein